MADEQQPTRPPGWAGMDARREGKPVEACPYQPGPQRTAWVVGWYIAAPEKEAPEKEAPANAR